MLVAWPLLGAVPPVACQRLQQMDYNTNVGVVRLIVRTEDKRKKRGEKRGQRTGSEDGGNAKRKKVKMNVETAELNEEVKCLGEDRTREQSMSIRTGRG